MAQYFQASFFASHGQEENIFHMLALCLSFYRGQRDIYSREQCFIFLKTQHAVFSSKALVFKQESVI